MTQTLKPSQPQTQLGRMLGEYMRQDQLVLQVCDECGTIQYPPRECCRACLSVTLSWRKVANSGCVLALSELYHSLKSFFSEKLPILLASVRMKDGVTVLAFCDDNLAPNQQVKLVPHNSDRQFGFKATPTKNEGAP